MEQVPPALYARLGPAAAAGLLDLLEHARKECAASVTSAAVERFEHRLGEETTALRVEIGAVRSEMREGFAALRADLQASGAAMRAEIRETAATLRQESAAAHAELIKWLFLFWLGQAAAMIGFMTALRP